MTNTAGQVIPRLIKHRRTPWVTTQQCQIDANNQHSNPNQHNSQSTVSAMGTSHLLGIKIKIKGYGKGIT
jgi:hypothetical protein